MKCLEDWGSVVASGKELDRKEVNTLDIKQKKKNIMA